MLSSASALAEETLPAASSTSESRVDAYRLVFEDKDASTANENAYRTEYKSDGSNQSAQIYNAVLPYCGTKYTFGCISSIEAKTSGEAVWEVLTPGERFWNGEIAAFTPNADGSRKNYFWSSWDGVEEVGLPPSGKVQLFNSSLHTHGGGAGYVVKALMYGYEENRGKFMTSTFGINVIPVKVLKYDPIKPENSEIFSVQNYTFPKDLEFRITVKLGALYQQLNGWFFGRVTDALIDMNPTKKTLVITGKASTSPVQTGYMPYPAPEKFKDSFNDRRENFYGKLSSYVFPASNGSNLNYWLKYKDYLFPNSEYENQVWQIDAAPRSSLEVNQDFEKCLKGTAGITGLLTTNATAYETNPPKWSSKDSTLTYQVAGPELLSDGSKNLGTYLLAIRADVASCLWKTDLRNAKATVEVTNGDGATGTQIATTTMSQRNGWLYFSASGFHFSAPTIKVKLNSEKMLKITCFKGKTKKIITGTSPKCPSGYKKS